MAENQVQSEAAVVADIVKQHIAPNLVEVFGPAQGKDHAHVLVLPSGLKAASIKPFLDEYRTAPERRKGTAKLEDLDSFIAHVKRFADEDSAIFCDRSNEAAPQLVAVLDYHRKGAAGHPRFGEHRATYAFPLADEWKKWDDANGEWMSQADFAAFLEDRIADVADPASAGASAKEFLDALMVDFASPSRLLELSRGLSIRVGARFVQRVNLQSGESTLNFETQHQDENGGPLKVPGAFLIAIPVFRNDALYQVPVRLRYRTNGSAVQWCFDAWRTDAVLEDAIKGACKKVGDVTTLPLFMGAPER